MFESSKLGELFVWLVARDWRERRETREGHALLEQPAECGEALTVTDFQAVCHRFYFLLAEDLLRGGMPWSGISRRSGVPTEALLRRKAETD
jgi:hypothetical protein